MKMSNAELAQYITIAFHHRTNAHVHLCTRLAKLKKHLPYNSTFEARSSPFSSHSSPSPSSLSPSSNQNTHTTIHHTQPSHLAQSVPTRTTNAVEHSEDEEDDLEEHSHEVIDKLVNSFTELDIM